MMHQVDLHAADVDRAHAARLQRPHGGDRLRLGVVEAALSLGIDRPGPGLTPPVRGSGRPLSTRPIAASRCAASAGALRGRDGAAHWVQGAARAGGLASRGSEQQDAGEQAGEAVAHGGVRAQLELREACLREADAAMPPGSYERNAAMQNNRLHCE